MLIQDDRTHAEKQTHDTLIFAHDTFLSGWGECENNGISYCAWAARPEDVDDVETWVRGRDDMKRVRLVSANHVPQLGPNDHYHIYVVGPCHRALESTE